MESLSTLLIGLAVKQGNTLALCQSVALNSLERLPCPRMALPVGGILKGGAPDKKNRNQEETGQEAKARV